MEAKEITKETKEEKRLKFLKEYKNLFIVTYGALFCQMTHYAMQSKLDKNEIYTYLDEARHAILFLGQINKPIVEPEEMSFGKFQSGNPDAFRTHVPRTTPYSILLEMVVRAEGPHNSDAIKKTLEVFAESILKQNKKMYFYATVVSKSDFNDIDHKGNPKKATPEPYWGASLSCSGRKVSQIMLALNCLFNWHEKIAEAVTFAQNNTEKGGILEFPRIVTSEAYKHEDFTLIAHPPCSKCVQVFASCTFKPTVEIPKNATWEFGNCAENESISKLLDGHPYLKNFVKYCAQATGEQMPKLKTDPMQILKELKWSGELIQFISAR
ncbi:uncharacterized protein LOC133354164 [Lethenteron reissneri]|uniref:uncharacterized protein LOC133354164 n=1 Tax=Lethenteron reissneri TaxID=7753 RepID=UPI002AB7BE5D|nr:uncharacterized protein LOC133354164 [Lethenteron reissneri]